MASKYWVTKKDFWISSSERALKTFAQTFLAMIGAQAFDVLAANWMSLLSVSLGAAVLSYMTSVVSAEIGTKGSPSLVE